jgi:hypothetical protein
MCPFPGDHVGWRRQVGWVMASMPPPVYCLWGMLVLNLPSNILLAPLLLWPLLPPASQPAHGRVGDSGPAGPGDCGGGGARD